MSMFTKIDPAQAFADWSEKITLATGVSDVEKLKSMSNMCAIKESIEDQKRSVGLMSENYSSESPANIPGMGATTFPSDPGTAPGSSPAPFYQTDYKTGSGDIPTTKLSIAMNVAAYTIGLELLPFINMDMPSTMFAYMDAIYGGGELTETGTSPIYFLIENDAIDATWKATADLTKGDVVYLAPQTADALVAGEAVKCTFMQYHRFKKALIVKSESVGDILVAGGYTPNAAYTEQSVVDIIGASAGIFDEASTDVADTVSNTLADPAKLDYVSATDMFVLGVGHNDGITETPMSRATAEKGTSNTVNLRMFSTAVEAQASEIIASVERIQEADLGAYGINAMNSLYKEAQNQLTQTINRQILNDFFRLGVTNASQLKSSQGLDLNVFVGPAATTSKDLANFGVSEFKDILGVDRSADFEGVQNGETNSAAENLWTRQRRLRSTIGAMSHIIGSVGRKGRGDVAVVNPQIAAAILDLSEGLTAAPDNSQILAGTDNLYYIGIVSGVKVFCDPMMAWTDTRISVGRKGGAESPGLKFCAYDLANAIEVVPEQTLGKKVSLLSRYTIVHSGFYPELQYLTVALANDFGAWTN